MSAAVETYRDDLEATYAVDFSRDHEPTKKRARFPEYKRRGSAPSRVSGMHCRRNKRWTWGTGRGARLLNTRAFASCIAFAVASLAATAFGAPMTIPMKTVGDPGNIGNSVSSPAGLGAVAGIFQIGETEVTNSQFVTFLNSVDPDGVNPRGIYSSDMTTSPIGGITFDFNAAAGAKYAVKPGTGPASSPFGSMPVNFVSWFTAARFINWLENGQQGGAASAESGTYNLNGATTGQVVARNPGSTYFLPSTNEWYKAAFYNGAGGYWDYQTQSNSVPTATVSDFTLVNAANWGSVAAGPVAVGSYTNVTSHYDLYDMLGNVTEWVENGSNSNAFLMGANFGNPNIVAWNARAAGVQRLFAADSMSQATGFRVAAVPEPSTYALLAASAAGLGGFSWVKRRRRLAA